VRSFQVKEETPLQDFLFKALPELKKTKIKQVLKFGSAHVNGREVTWYKYPLKPGDKVEILGKEHASAERSKAQLGLKIVYEDEDLLVVEKPAGLLTMGTEREKEATLYFMLTEYVRGKIKNERGRVFIVHRLDRDASGLIVFAKIDTVKRALQGGWKLAIKKYYAITEGTPKKRSGTIENYLTEDHFKRVYSVSKDHPEAQWAATHYRVLGENGGYALLEIMLETGRKNQIRVHLSGLGCPIMGDEKYGAKSDPLRRLALHAYFLSFDHPVTGELKTFQTALPAPFKKIFPDI
jgi:RluA family pseudouridine synthase